MGTGSDGSTRDDFRDEEPGKILHEIRSGELTQLGIKPHNPYYGTADATQLWLILLSEYWRWTGADEFIRGLRDNAYAALRWIDEYGDLDGDGYVEYATRSPQGLGNQCWRDSWDGIRFADGSIPVLPIATCEIQGYTYDAKLRLAELADGPLQDPELARRLRAEADELRDRFNRDFWIDDRGGYYAVGLDGDKQMTVPAGATEAIFRLYNGMQGVPGNRCNRPNSACQRPTSTSVTGRPTNPNRTRFVARCRKAIAGSRQAFANATRARQGDRTAPERSRYPRPPRRGPIPLRTTGRPDPREGAPPAHPAPQRPTQPRGQPRARAAQPGSSIEQEPEFATEKEPDGAGGSVFHFTFGSIQTRSTQRATH
ncbi:hypothetical protein ABGB16_06840 [Micromonospora sp. B11E3]|uniref:amylo-alpha-1,6-glucosidase n=1 Tax=Micromonospora sp. B11E3 TaxID=3153562 RepID=UPI00325E6EFA